MLHIKFQASEPSGSDEEFKYFFLCISMVRTLDPLARDHLEPWDLHLNKLGKGRLASAIYEISSILAKLL